MLRECPKAFRISIEFQKMYWPPYGFTAHHHREAEKPSLFPCPPWQIYYTIQSLIADAVPIYPPAPWFGCLVVWWVALLPWH